MRETPRQNVPKKEFEKETAAAISRRDVLRGGAALAVATMVAGDTFPTMSGIEKPNRSRESNTPAVETAEDNSFENQFKKRERIAVGNFGSAEVVDVSPEHLKDDVPILVAPAWAVPVQGYKETIRTLTEQSRRVVSIDHPRIGGKIELNDQEKDILKEYPQEEVRKALTILKVLTAKTIRKTDVIAHSEGAANVAIAALLHPEKFRNIVFFAPAGLIGEDTIGRLAQGFAAQGPRPPSLDKIEVTEEDKAAAHAAGREAIEYPEIPAWQVPTGLDNPLVQVGKYVAQNPVRATNEGIGLSQIQIHDILRQLHEKGVGIVVMSDVDDPIFPMDKMLPMLHTNMLDGFLSVRGGHGQLVENPDYYATAAETMLTRLKEKQERKSTIDTSD